MFRFKVIWWWGHGDGSAEVRAWSRKHALRLAHQLAKAQKPKADVRGVGVTA